MVGGLDLLEARRAFVDLARPSVAYCRSVGIDFIHVEPHAGGPFLAPIRTDRRWFDFAEDGDEAVIVEARGADAVSVVDLVAFAPSDPALWWTSIGAAVALGEAAAVNPATYFGDAPLRLFRTPEAWLQARCDGVVILDPVRGGRWLLNAPATRLAAEDERHASEIDSMRQAVVRGQRILVPTRKAA